MSPNVDIDKIRKIQNLKDGFAEIEQKFKSLTLTLTEYSLKDAIGELCTKKFRVTRISGRIRRQKAPY